MKLWLAELKTEMEGKKFRSSPMPPTGVPLSIAFLYANNEYVEIKRKSIISVPITCEKSV